MSLVEIEGITIRFGAISAVKNLTLRIESGEILGLIGPNGSGKTTTIRAVLGLQTCDEGSIRVAGHDVLADPFSARGEMVWVPDQYGVYDSLTVRETVDFFGCLHGVEDHERAARVEEAIDRFTLRDLADTQTGTLSRGVRQRLMMARMHLASPRLLILDEPAGGLDPRARRLLFDWLVASAAEGAAVLITSHVLADLTEICTSVAVIESGELCIAGKVDEVRRALLPRLEVRFDFLAGSDVAAEFLKQRPGVTNMKLDEASIAFEFSGDMSALAALNRELSAIAGVEIISFSSSRRDLESIFLAATKGQVT